MWLRGLAIVLLFYFFAILQNSFLAHFSIFSITPNFILVFYFLLIFFEKPYKYYFGLFSSVVAGFFLDVLSHSFFGVSIISLLVLLFLVKKALQLLWDRRDEYLVFYFMPLFVVFLMLYNLFLNLSMFFLNSPFADFTVNWIFLVVVVYNLLFAVPGFYLFKKFNIFKNSEKCF